MNAKTDSTLKTSHIPLFFKFPYFYCGCGRIMGVVSAVLFTMVEVFKIGSGIQIVWAFKKNVAAVSNFSLNNYHLEFKKES